MIPLVTNMLFMGYAAKDILNFVAKKIHGMEKGIEGARTSGYSDDDILKFISGKMPKGKQKQVEEATTDQEKYLKSIGLKTKAEKQETARKGINTAIGIGSTLAGAYGLYNQYAKRFPKGQWEPDFAGETIDVSPKQIPYNPGMEKGPRGPNQFQMMSPGNPIKPQMPSPQPAMPVNPIQPIQPPAQTIMKSKQPGVNPAAAATIASSQVPIQPPPQQSMEPVIQAPSAPIVSPSDVLKQAKLDSLIQTMTAAGHKPEEIVDYLQNSYPEHVKNIENATKEPLLNSVYRHLGKKMKKPKLVEGLQADLQKQYGGPNEINEGEGQIQPPSAPGASDKLQQRGANPKETEKGVEGEKPSESKKSGDVVSLADGEVGTIERINKDHVVVDINGKKRPVNLGWVEDLPIRQKDLADLHKDLVKGIEKESGGEVSKAVMWAGYDPVNKKLHYLPWDGDFYTYEDIPPDIAERLNKLVTRKSSGESIIGPWKAGTNSVMGAAMGEIIRELQASRGGKGKEYSGKAVPVYNAYEPAHKAVKEKKKAEREEERRRKKQQA